MRVLLVLVECGNETWVCSQGLYGHEAEAILTQRKGPDAIDRRSNSGQTAVK